MTRFSKYRELLSLARDLNAEADRLGDSHPGKWDRRIEAAEHRLKAEHMAGRLTDAEFWTEMAECADARLA